MTWHIVVIKDGEEIDRSPSIEGDPEDALVFQIGMEGLTSALQDGDTQLSDALFDLAEFVAEHHLTEVTKPNGETYVLVEV